MKLLVYGSLKRGCVNHEYLKQASYIKDIKIKGSLYMKEDRYFPHLIIDNKKDIICELYEIPEKLLKHLDRLEGHPYFFKRKEIYIKELNEQVFIYEYILQQNENVDDFIEINNFK